MKVYVTGSSGQLGSAVIHHLKAQGYTVYGVDIIPAGTTSELLDIKDKQAVDVSTYGFDAIIHTAAIHGKHYELNYSRQTFIDTNILGTLNLLEACIKNSINRFLYISTTSVYGSALVDEEKAVWVDELLKEAPRDIYDITKQTAEQLCKDFFYKEGLQTSVYRVGRFLPENDNLRLNHRIYRGLDERDGAQALRLALNKNFENFEVFNIAAGSPFNRSEQELLKRSPKEAILRYYPQAEEVYRANGWLFPKSIDRVYVCDKAKTLLGYEPEYTFGYLLNEQL